MYQLSYIDDRLLPINDAAAEFETGLIPGSIIEMFLPDENDWQEQTVRKLLTQTLKKTKKFTQIDFSGFTNPAFFLNHLKTPGFVPRSIILDWDFGTFQADESIKEILKRTTAKIFPLTGNDLKEEVEELLQPIRQEFGDRISEVYKKADGSHKIEKYTQENLLEDIIEDLTTIPESKQFDDVQIEFYPSYVVPTFDLFWMVRSIVGDELVREFVENDLLTINQERIEKIFNSSNVKFYLSKHNTRLYSENGLALQGFYDDEAMSEPLSPLYALNNYDIAILETTVEKGTSKIFGEDES